MSRTSADITKTANELQAKLEKLRKEARRMKKLEEQQAEEERRQQHWSSSSMRRWCFTLAVRSRYMITCPTAWRT